MSDPTHENRTVAIGTPDGVLRGTVAVKRGPMRLTGLVQTGYALTTALVQRANQLEEEGGRRISCKPGCGACCRHMVPVSPPEALYLTELVEGFEPQRRAAVTQRFDEVVAALERRDMIGRLLDPAIGNDPFMPVAREYFELQQACPFLVDESCSIHQHRPVVCRDYNVTSPAEWCARPYDHDVAKVAMPLPLSVPLARASARMLGTRPQLIPLTLAPRWVAEHPEVRARTWPGPELFDALLDELAELYPVEEAGEDAE